MMQDTELQSALTQLVAAEAELDRLILQLKEVTGTIGLLVLTIKRLLKKP